MPPRITQNTNGMMGKRAAANVAMVATIGRPWMHARFNAAETKRLMHDVLKQTEPDFKLLDWTTKGDYQHLLEWCLEVGPLRIAEQGSLGFSLLSGPALQMGKHYAYHTAWREELEEALLHAREAHIHTMLVQNGKVS